MMFLTVLLHLFRPAVSVTSMELRYCTVVLTFFVVQAVDPPEWAVHNMSYYCPKKWTFSSRGAQLLDKDICRLGRDFYIVDMKNLSTSRPIPVCKVDKTLLMKSCPRELLRRMVSEKVTTLACPRHAPILLKDTTVCEVNNRLYLMPDVIRDMLCYILDGPSVCPNLEAGAGTSAQVPLNAANPDPQAVTQRCAADITFLRDFDGLMLCKRNPGAYYLVDENNQRVCRVPEQFESAIEKCKADHLNLILSHIMEGEATVPGGVEVVCPRTEAELSSTNGYAICRWEQTYVWANVPQHTVECVLTPEGQTAVQTCPQSALQSIIGSGAYLPTTTSATTQAIDCGSQPCNAQEQCIQHGDGYHCIQGPLRKITDFEIMRHIRVCAKTDIINLPVTCFYICAPRTTFYFSLNLNKKIICRRQRRPNKWNRWEHCQGDALALLMEATLSEAPPQVALKRPLFQVKGEMQARGSAQALESGSRQTAEVKRKFGVYILKSLPDNKSRVVLVQLEGKTQTASNRSHRSEDSQRFSNQGHKTHQGQHSTVNTTRGSPSRPNSLKDNSIGKLSQTKARIHDQPSSRLRLMRQNSDATVDIVLRFTVESSNTALDKETYKEKLQGNMMENYQEFEDETGLEVYTSSIQLTAVDVETTRETLSSTSVNIVELLAIVGLVVFSLVALTGIYLLTTLRRSTSRPGHRQAC